MIAPQRVEPDPEKRLLRIVWRDGVRSEIPYQKLRDLCPCARCKASRDQGRAPLPMALTTKLLGWKKVGNYALHFAWGDSHSDGIFAFDFLRAMTEGDAAAAASDAPKV